MRKHLLHDVFQCEAEFGDLAGNIGKLARTGVVVLCSARTVKAKHIIFQHTNCGSAASGLRCGTQISAKQDLEKYRKITTEEALVCCLGGVCVQIFPYVPNDVCHQSKDRIVDRNPEVLLSSASNLDVPCDREYRTAGLGQALQTRRHGASRLVGFPSQASRVRLPDARVVHHPVLPHATDGAQWGSATGPAKIQHDKKRRKQRTPPMRLYNMSQLWLTRG